jgi:hypothetical protein
VDSFGDGKGTDVAHDAASQALVRMLLQHGDQVGSHGGWIHNYFGEHVNDSNEREFSKFIDLNIDSLQHVTHRPITEYSAPVGNHPQWVSKYLEKRGVIAYYFAGDTGMAPTRVYRDDTRDGNSIWAFPIVHLGRYASFEEMGFDNVPAPIVREWLNSVTDFTARNRTTRLVYTHPLGAVRYLKALEAWFRHTSELQSTHRFRWYTMTQIASFLNARLGIYWNVDRLRSKDVELVANSAKSLRHQTWILPKTLYANPHVVRGVADIRAQGDDWLIIAGDCDKLAVEMIPLKTD